MLAFVLGFLALIAALLFPTVSQSLVNAGVFDDIEHFSDKDCKFLKSADLEGCEGAEVFGGLVYFACTSVKGRAQFFPAATRSASNPLRAQGWIAVLDPKTEIVKKLKFENFGNNEFNSHGISLWQDSREKVLYIAAVNHKLSGSVIELFSHNIGSGSLKHFKTVIDKNIQNPNDVALVAKDKFYVTNDFHSEGILRIIQLYFRLASGDVVFYNGEHGRIVVPSLVYPNGILLSPSKAQIYVALTTNRQLQIYERKDSDGLRLIDTIDAQMGLDNIGVDSETGAIYLAGHPKMLLTNRAFKDPSTLAPSKVVKITNNTAGDIFYGKKYMVETVWADDGSGLSTSSQAVVTGGKTFISGILSKGIIVCRVVL